MPAVLRNLGHHGQAAEDWDCPRFLNLDDLRWQHPLHSQVRRGCMTAGRFQQRINLYVVTPVVTVISWESVRATRQEAQNEQQEAHDRWD